MFFATKPPNRSEQGVALAFVLLMVTVALSAVVGLMAYTTSSTHRAWRAIALDQSTAATDASLEVAYSLIQGDLATLSPTAVASNLANGTYASQTSTIVTQQIPGVTALQVGITNLGSTNAEETLYGIFAQAAVTGNGDLALPTRAQLNLALVDKPVTAFSYFYDVDMEHYPWHNWTVTGPVYCGRTNYFCPTSGATLTFQERVYSVGGIRNVPHPLDEDQSGINGTIVYQVPPLEGVPSMVATAPAGETNRMHWILEIPSNPSAEFGSRTGSERFFLKADVILRVWDSGGAVYRGPKHDNIAHNAALITTNLAAITGVDTNLVFTDHRNNTTYQSARGIRLTRQGLTNLLNEAFAAFPFTPPPASPVFYVSDERSSGGGVSFYGVIIQGCETLPFTAFALATPNPLYTHGHFNRVNPIPALLACDAITVLSEDWTDTEGNLSVNNAGRKASSTTVNAAFVTGIVPAGGGYGSGWVANVTRLLEHWDSRTLSSTGSVAVLFDSEIATGKFEHGDPIYYRPSVRNFVFQDWFATIATDVPPKATLVTRGDYARLPPE